MRLTRLDDARYLQNIWWALQRFSDDNAGMLPDDLEGLVKAGHLSGWNFLSPGSEIPHPMKSQEVARGRCDYIYLVGKSTPAATFRGKPIACTAPGLLGAKYTNVLYGMDGFVLGYSDPPKSVQAFLKDARQDSPTNARRK